MSIENIEWMESVLAIFEPSAVAGSDQTIIVVELDTLDASDQEL